MRQLFDMFVVFSASCLKLHLGSILVPFLGAKLAPKSTLFGIDSRSQKKHRTKSSRVLQACCEHAAAGGKEEVRRGGGRPLLRAWLKLSSSDLRNEEL